MLESVIVPARYQVHRRYSLAVLLLVVAGVAGACSRTASLRFDKEMAERECMKQQLIEEEGGFRFDKLECIRVQCRTQLWPKAPDFESNDALQLRVAQVNHFCSACGTLHSARPCEPGEQEPR